MIHHPLYKPSKICIEKSAIDYNNYVHNNKKKTDKLKSCKSFQAEVQIKSRSKT